VALTTHSEVLMRFTKEYSYYPSGYSWPDIGVILTFSLLSTEIIKDNGSVLNATCSTVRLDKYCLMYSI
jgi:hypothetical protein